MGPALGGALAQPGESFPALFPQGTLFEQFPFLLPNLVCAMVLAIGVVIGLLFLEETHESKKHRRDVGLEAGRWLLRRFKNRPEPIIYIKARETDIEAYDVGLEDEAPPGYRTTEGSPCQPSSRAQSPMAVPADIKLTGHRHIAGSTRGIRRAFTRQVILNIAGFGLLA